MHPEPGAVGEGMPGSPEASCFSLPFVLGVLVFPGVWCPQGQREGLEGHSTVLAYIQADSVHRSQAQVILRVPCWRSLFGPSAPLSVPKPEQLGSPAIADIHKLSLKFPSL